MLLEEIKQPLTGIKGIGPSAVKALSSQGIRDLASLLWYLPRAWDDRSKAISFAEARRTWYDLGSGDLPPSNAMEAQAGIFNTKAVVLEHQWVHRGKKPFLKILVHDETAQLNLVCFNRDFLAKSLPPGTQVVIHGRLEEHFGELQSSSFEHRVGDHGDFHRILPVYPLAGELSQALLRKVIPQALSTLGIGISENLPSDLVQHHGLMGRKEALTAIHMPPNQVELARATRRLIYEELFYLQLQLGLLKVMRQRQAQEASSNARLPAPGLPGATEPAPTNPQAKLSVPAASATSTLGPAPAATATSTIGAHTQPYTKPCPLAQTFLKRLGFTLTSAQERVVGEIIADLNRPYPMARLVQGDVGSGKTVIALLAALEIIQTGGQVALMVPTVLLARQHAQKAAALLEPLGITVALHAGPLKKSQKSPLLDAIASGDAQFIIGTHGLFSEGTTYKNLRMAIIDEQHRFGVRQRQALYQKAEHPHLLMMTATPIPQTLALTLYGDMDVSVVDTLPPGRTPIETHLTKMGNEDKTYVWVEKELAKGRQAYFVYPRIEEGEGITAAPEHLATGHPTAENSAPGNSQHGILKSAEAMYEALARRLGPKKVVLVHGKMPDEEKSLAMEQFTSGKVPVLVATSVVEVGVDVPNATCMVIEHAERFGMAALHQLRGRVGRGSHKSYCFLVYSMPLSEVGKARLMALKEHADGFVLAEKDLEIRGPGDLSGTEQSGYLKLRIADLIRDAAVMVQAKRDVEAILTQDPELTLPQHQALACTLALQNAQTAQSEQSYPTQESP